MLSQSCKHGMGLRDVTSRRRGGAGGRRAGWHGTAARPPDRRPPAARCARAASHHGEAPPAGVPSPPAPPSRCPGSRSYPLHQRFRFVILIRLTERCGRWTDERLLRSASSSRRIPLRTRVRSPTPFNIDYLLYYTETTQHY